jgi:hypothetical protein
MTITNGPHEKLLSYVYKPGTWRIGVTNMPTEGGPEDSFTHFLFGKTNGKALIYGTNLDAFRNAIGRPLTQYYCDITKYPGVNKRIVDQPPFGCRDATFTLSWNNPNVNLGLTIIGPSGEEIESVLDESTESQKIHLDQLGECINEQYYSIIVYALGDISSETEFTVDYSWRQNISRQEGDSISSACQAAIFASTTNSPMLYVKPESIPDCTKNALTTLGVKNIHIYDINEQISQDAYSQLKNIATIKSHHTTYKDAYDAITGHTGQYDIIFSTIDPWSYWMYTHKARELRPYGEFDEAFYFGPASYAAAHHGSPLILVDNHPELSKAVVWHNEFWKKHGNGYVDIPVAQMVITGRVVYGFLEDYDLDREGNETILTVGGQYDLAPSWTRTFAGVANPGHIIGTPIDATNQICRNIFYPSLIFENPALNREITLTNGSKSIRTQPSLIRPFQRLFERIRSPYGSNLRIIKPSKKESYIYPILHTYGCYSHRFNERGSIYWGAKYQTRDGIIPGETISLNEIDQGSREIFEGIPGSYHPDMAETVILPFYASKAGYMNAYSTNFDITIDNLNQGVISWYMVLHGDSQNGGQLAWYDPQSVYKQSGSQLLQKLAGLVLGLYPLTAEINPWRGYDQLWGSTEEPDSATLNAEIGLFLGILGLADREGFLHGGFLKTGLDFVPSNIPLMGINRQNYYDGLVGPYSITAMLTKFGYSHTAKEIDEKLENLHSMNFHANSCLIGCKYLHIAFMRHGSVIQEIDPWPTSYWGGVVFQEIPRDLALGKTIGESYAEGRSKIGIQYLFEDDEEIEWWWDSAENVVLFGDPDLRIWIPSDKWSSNNHWEWNEVQPLQGDSNIILSGHQPFGVSTYPNQFQRNILLDYIWVLAIILIALIGVILFFVMKKQKK